MEHHKIKKELKTKTGVVYPVGSYASVTFPGDGIICLLHLSDGSRMKMYACNLHKYLEGFDSTPDDDTLERWGFDGVCESVTGYTVEPDGHSEDGAPSWLLALGLC
jgi:hypothetical protein